MRKTALIAVGLIFAVIVPVLAYTFRAPMQVAPTTQESESTTLTVYQVGLAYVVTRIETTFTGGRASILIPASVILETLRIVDPDPLAITLKGSVPARMLLVKGDNITVRTEAAVYTGTYEGVKEGYLVLIRSGSAVLVKVDSIIAIEVDHAVSVETQADVVQVSLQAPVPDGPYNVTATYLTRGTTWRASHRLDVDNGSIRTWASMTSTENWTDVRLSLVVGHPHIVFEEPFRPVYTNGKLDIVTPGRVEWTTTALGEYHEFQLTEPISLAAGETAMLLLMNGTVNVQREYFWSGSQPYYYGAIPPVSESPVTEYVNVTNTLSQPLPRGVAQFYRDEKWVGGDSMPYIPVEASVKMTIGLALDAQVKHQVLSIQHLASVDRVTVQLTAQNHKTDDITLVLEQTIPYDATLVEANPRPQQLGQTLTWTVPVAHGASTVVTYTYEIPVRK